MNKNVCLLISSPEAYRDVFNISYELISKNWSGCPYRKIYATDFCDEYGLNGFTVLSFPTIDNWIERVLKALENIPEEYIILPADDLFFKKKIDDNYFEKVLEFMKDNNSKYCRLFKNNHFAKKRNKLEGNIYQMYYYQSYAINLLGGIWKKDYLIELLSSAGSNPWELESNLQKTSLTYSKQKIKGCIYLHNDIFHHAVYKGRWIRDINKVLIKNDLKVTLTRKKVSILKSFEIFLKDLFRDSISPKARYAIKRLTSKFIKYDSKY